MSKACKECNFLSPNSAHYCGGCGMRFPNTHYWKVYDSSKFELVPLEKASETNISKNPEILELSKKINEMESRIKVEKEKSHKELREYEWREYALKKEMDRLNTKWYKRVYKEFDRFVDDNILYGISVLFTIIPIAISLMLVLIVGLGYIFK